MDLPVTSRREVLSEYLIIEATESILALVASQCFEELPSHGGVQ